MIELLVVIAIIAILAAILFPVFAQAREKARAASCLSNEKQMGTAVQMYAQDYDEGMPAWDSYYACLSQIGTGCGADATDRYWDAVLIPYVKNGNPQLNDRSGVWHCPSQSNFSYRSYGYSQMLMREGWETNTNGTKYRWPSLPLIDMSAQTVFVGESGQPGRLAPPWWFQSSFIRGGTTTVVPGAGNQSTSWEWPDRHSGGSNYVFCDGHAKWLKDATAYPPGMSAPRNTTANLGAAYKSCVEYFAATSGERDFCRSKY